MRRLYSGLIVCAAPIAFAVVLWRGLRDRAYWQHLRERFGWGPASPAPGIWLHAVSLGEMSAAAPLVRAVRARHPQVPLVVTTATPAGRSSAQSLFGDGVDIRFLPYDTPGSVRRFLERIRPRLALIMETELWPNLFQECERRGVPVILASARLSAKSAARYRRLGRLFGGLFTDNVTVAAQTDADAARFQSIAATSSTDDVPNTADDVPTPAAGAHILVTGNVKFDIQVDERAVREGSGLRSSLGASRPAWIAGSTHAGEEEQALDAHALLLKVRPDALAIIVPRHKDRFAAVADLLARRGIPFTRRSSGTTPDAGHPVLLADTLGELNLLYSAADVAFVGGSLVAIGGHNLLEPAALGLPVLTGPHYFNNPEIARLLIERGAALPVCGAAEMAATLIRLFEDPGERLRIGLTGKELVAANRGSVARLLELIERKLG